MPITYRLAEQSEWDKVEQLWREGFPDKKCPYSDRTEVVLAEEDGKVVGLLVAQSILHIDQLIIAPSHTGKAKPEKLLQVLEEQVAKPLGVGGYVSFTTRRLDRGMASVGYDTPPWFVYKKEF